MREPLPQSMRYLRVCGPLTCRHQKETRGCMVEFRMPGLADGCCKEGSLLFCTKKKKNVCIFERLHVCLRTGHQISVKGALGEGGGGHEWLKTFTSVRAGDGVGL